MSKYTSDHARAYTLSLLFGRGKWGAPFSQPADDMLAHFIVPSPAFKGNYERTCMPSYVVNPDLTTKPTRQHAYCQICRRILLVAKRGDLIPARMDK